MDELDKAISKGDIEVLKAAIEASGGGLPPASAEVQQQWLTTAIERGQVRAIALLAEAGLCLSGPLVEAAGKGDLESVRCLLSLGADPNSVRRLCPSSVLYRSALKEACLHRHDQIAELLLAAGADINAVDDWPGETVLHAAIKRADAPGGIDVVETLLEHGADCRLHSKDGVTPLLLAAKLGRARCVRALLARGVSPDEVDADGDTALHLALMHNRRAAVREMLATDMAIDTPGSDGGTPLILAAQAGYHDVIRTLLRRGAAVGAVADGGNTALHLAAQNGHLKAVRVLLAHGAEVSACDDAGTTPLHRAAYNGHAEVAEMLCAAGAAVDARDKKGWTPLHPAVRNGHLAATRVLVAQGADPAGLSTQGEHALGMAIRAGRTSVVLWLLKHGADLFHPDPCQAAQQRPYLHEVAALGKVTLARAFVERGMDLDAEDKWGRSAVQVAAIEGRKRLVDALTAMGATVPPEGLEVWPRERQRPSRRHICIH